MKLSAIQNAALLDVTKAKTQERTTLAQAKMEAQLLAQEHVRLATLAAQTHTDNTVATAHRHYGVPKARITTALLTTNPNEVYERLQRTQQIADAATLADAHALANPVTLIARDPEGATYRFRNFRFPAQPEDVPSYSLTLYVPNKPDGTPNPARAVVSDTTPDTPDTSGPLNAIRLATNTSNATDETK